MTTPNNHPPTPMEALAAMQADRERVGKCVTALTELVTDLQAVLTLAQRGIMTSDEICQKVSDRLNEYIIPVYDDSYAEWADIPCECEHCVAAVRQAAHDGLRGWTTIIA